MRRLALLPILSLGLLSCSEESAEIPPSGDSAETKAQVDVIKIPSGVKISLFFGDNVDSMGIYSDGRGHVVTKDYKTINKDWSTEDYAEIRALCMKVINSQEVNDERIGGPGFEMISIVFGNGRTATDFRYGIVRPEEFPQEVKDLTEAVLALQSRDAE